MITAQPRAMLAAQVTHLNRLFQVLSITCAVQPSRGCPLTLHSYIGSLISLRGCTGRWPTTIKSLPVSYAIAYCQAFLEVESALTVLPPTKLAQHQHI